MAQSFWIDAERIVDRVVVLDEESIYVANPKADGIPPIRAALEAGRPASDAVKDDPVIIPLASITEVSYDRNADDVEIHFQRAKGAGEEDIHFGSAAERDDFADQLAERLQGFESRTVEWSRPRAALGPACFGLAAGFLTWLFHGLATSLAAGAEIEISGRRSGLKRLVVAVVDLLGPVGVLIAGGVLIALTAWYLVLRVKTPPIMTTLKRTR